MMLVYSANDAAYTIAINGLALSRPLADSGMNKKAAEIGHDSRKFQNPHGLDADGHYSTARDLCSDGPLCARTLSTHRVSVVYTRSYTNGRREQRTFHSNRWPYDTPPEAFALKRVNPAMPCLLRSFQGRGNITLYTCVLLVAGPHRVVLTIQPFWWTTYCNYNCVSIQRWPDCSDPHELRIISCFAAVGFHQLPPRIWFGLDLRLYLSDVYAFTLLSCSHDQLVSFNRLVSGFQCR